MEDNGVSRPINHFNEVFMTRGSKAVQEAWREKYRKNRDEAIDLINDPDITFPILYTLAPELTDLDEALSAKNQLAVNHIFNILKSDPFGLLDDIDLLDQYHYCVDCFSWILKTGGFETLDDHYAYVIDQTCFLLLLDFKMDCLTEIVDILFYRNRTGGQRHYLLSTFYDAGIPKGLIYIAKYLRSTDPLDVALAKQILFFIPDVAHASTPENEELVLSWLEENENYLIYTAENNDSHPYPVPYHIHYAAKYFGLPVSKATSQPIFSIGQDMNHKWAEFQALPQHIQSRLSAYSLKLRHWNRAEWKQWLETSLQTQVSIIVEGRSPYDYY